MAPITRRYPEWFLRKHSVTPSSLVPSRGGAFGPSGLGTSAARPVLLPAGRPAPPSPSATNLGATGLGTSAARIPKEWLR